MENEGMKAMATLDGVRTSKQGGYVASFSIPEIEKEKAMALLGLVPSNVEITIKIVE